MNSSASLQIFSAVGSLPGRALAKTTLHSGLALPDLRIADAGFVAVPSWPRVLSVTGVMGGNRALSGIAKDLTKMSAKSAIKIVVPDDTESTLFKWVSYRLTGSKNALKGASVASSVGQHPACYARLHRRTGCNGGGPSSCAPRHRRRPAAGDWPPAKKVKFTALFSKSPAINWLSAARIFLFGASGAARLVRRWASGISVLQLGSVLFPAWALSLPSGSSAAAVILRLSFRDILRSIRKRKWMAVP